MTTTVLTQIASTHNMYSEYASNKFLYLFFDVFFSFILSVTINVEKNVSNEL